MDNTVTPQSSKPPPQKAALSIGKAGEILWGCAWEAIILAFLVQIMGSIALGVTSNLWQQMVPSLPPVLPEQENAPQVFVVHFSILNWRSLGWIFAILFIGKAATSFAQYSRRQEVHQASAWLRGAAQRISAQWFSLVVVNAFVAFITVLVIQLTQRFSLTHLVWQFFGGVIHHVLQGIASLFPGEGDTRLFKAWADWYGANQLKFQFWLFYGAAICDDLGLPNYKSWGRSLWSRTLGRKAVASKAS